MTSTESDYCDTFDRMRTIWDQCPDGIDPEFDCGLDNLHYELAALRAAVNHN
jgi:hypothetical protein